ncbi:ABC transporter ATP-binding protein [Salinispirillum sp. LH 10-3-1]|uniref:ABC transporter ATP-binding protein n=1 Tax=Salinispirillum sp. LH 10-3-1 TaxID=2952525 RepID=A0AB38YH80_9GAMM
MQPVISVSHLVKRYQSVVAVDDISFQVAEGSCFGLLGPNGAGKTTTIELLEGIMQPTSGRILYFGAPLETRQLYRDIGIQFQHTALQDYLTVRETLRLFSSFYEQTLPITELVELCSLQEFINRDARKLSGGQRQRLLLALALVNDPKVVFMDEPTTGLDPQARHKFWDLVSAIKARGKTVILTTHYMDEAQTLCDQIAIMDRGRIVVTGAPADLLAEHFAGVLVWLNDTPVPADLMMRYGAQQRSGRLQFQTANVDALLAELIQAQVSLDSLQVQAPNLDDLFLKLTGSELRAGA